VQSRASTLGTRQVVSLEVAKFRTRSLPPERRSDVLAVAISEGHPDSSMADADVSLQ